jgi:hypothetical protein
MHTNILMSIQNNLTYSDLKAEFGPTGTQTLKSFPEYFERRNKYIMTWKDFLKNYFNENFINYKEKL